MLKIAIFSTLCSDCRSLPLGQERPFAQQYQRNLYITCQKYI